ncbi:MAG: hypothetical protein QOI24_2642 [Acidobacteriota bacterium]|jgi:hypothetical protein|nr:hypothetical protein [Acidobacteriota bacterium]
MIPHVAFRAYLSRLILSPGGNLDLTTHDPGASSQQSTVTNERLKT